MKTIETTSGRRIMGKLDHGADLLESLTSVCGDNGIRLGRVEAIGAMQNAVTGFYNQESREYEYQEIDKPVELLALVGNVSLKDGEPIVHAHVTLSDSDGNAIGGHLGPGTIVFACDFMIEEFHGEDLSRGMDEETGLPLWQ